MKIIQKNIKYILLLLVLLIIWLLIIQNDNFIYFNQLSDLLYQQGNLPSGEISIIEIDERTLDELGPYHTWTRDYVAEAIEMLNADSDNCPTVIGVDILYIGESTPEADAHLVEAAKTRDNVVFGSYLNFDNVLTEDNGTYSIERKVTLYEEPFDELLKVSTDGYVNGFNDSDGIVRHSLLTMLLDDGSAINSFAYSIYRKYALANGLDNNLSVPTNEDGLWYIDYTDKSGGYDESFSLCDVISGELPADYFADQIVLIGPYAEGLMDSYTASIDHSSDMYGVEIHANLLEAILAGRFKQEVPRLVLYIIILVLGCIAIILSIRKSLVPIVIYAITVILAYPLGCLGLYNLGYVIDPVLVPITIFCITIFAIILHYIRSLLEKREVEATFKRYVAPEIVDDIMKQGLDTIKLGGEAVDCAILFVDIRGFTTMSEVLEPEEVVSILNNYLELTSSSIFEYGGTLDKFIGDATMAIFNAPLPMDDYVYKAVCAAWRMVEKSHELAEVLEKQYGRSVSFGVGVHCGKAVVGNIGTNRRMDYTAIGDTVNTSARLEANAPKDTVYISERVVEALGDRIIYKSVGAIPLKGKSENLEVYKLLGLRG